MEKTTKLEFERFKGAANELIDKLGLRHFQVKFKHEHLPDSNAEIRGSVNNCVAVISMAIVKGENWVSPEKHARHEVCHLLAFELNSMALNGEAEWLVNRIEEQFVVRLSNFIETIYDERDNQ